MIEYFQFSYMLKKGGGNAGPNVHRVAVDYENVDQIRQILKQNEVEVVVSTLLLVDAKALDSQVNLIRGAAASGTVTKFIPSEYHLDFHKAIE